MANINYKKLIGDFMAYKHDVNENSPLKVLSKEQLNTIHGANWLIAEALSGALKKQGFEYKDGEIIEIKDKRL